MLPSTLPRPNCSQPASACVVAAPPANIARLTSKPKHVRIGQNMKLIEHMLDTYPCCGRVVFQPTCVIIFDDVVTVKPRNSRRPFNTTIAVADAHTGTTTAAMGPGTTTTRRLHPVPQQYHAKPKAYPPRPFQATLDDNNRGVTQGCVSDSLYDRAYQLHLQGNV